MASSPNATHSPSESSTTSKTLAMAPRSATNASMCRDQPLGPPAPRLLGVRPHGPSSCAGGGVEDLGGHPTRLQVGAPSGNPYHGPAQLGQVLIAGGGPPLGSSAGIAVGELVDLHVHAAPINADQRDRQRVALLDASQRRRDPVRDQRGVELDRGGGPDGVASPPAAVGRLRQRRRCLPRTGVPTGSAAPQREHRLSRRLSNERNRSPTAAFQGPPTRSPTSKQSANCPVPPNTSPKARLARPRFSPRRVRGGSITPLSLT